jgi:cyclic pyranopterin phosphate synthase
LRYIPHEKILRYEEMLELIHVLRDMGVAKVRMTGGEPFVRKEFIGFLDQAIQSFPGLDFRLTTNGTYLPEYADRLKSMGLETVNISLDTLNPRRYEQITGRDQFAPVWEGIHDCLRAGLRVKINVVALRGYNYDELEGFLELATDYPLDIRFIEFMPIGASTAWEEAQYWSMDELLARAKEMVRLEPAQSEEPNKGPARMFDLIAGRGRLGVISAISDHFCLQCNRLRVTPDGRLRTCLFSDKEYRLRPFFRNPRLSQRHLRSALRAAQAKKPLGFQLLQAKKGQAVCQRKMSAIGG